MDATRWTAWLTFGLYLSAEATLLLRPARTSGLARRLWTLGCAALLVHVACAFHFHHAWSHAAAYEHTARATGAVVGWAWGGGLYVNYVFALLWSADALWWWCSPLHHARRARWLAAVIHV